MDATNYWDQIAKHLYKETEVQFVNNLYMRKESKSLLFFYLLLFNKRLFEFFPVMLKNLDYMYKNPKEKLENYQQELKIVDFLQDGDYLLESDYNS